MLSSHLRSPGVAYCTNRPCTSTAASSCSSVTVVRLCSPTLIWALLQTLTRSGFRIAFCRTTKRPHVPKARRCSEHREPNRHKADCTPPGSGSSDASTSLGTAELGTLSEHAMKATKTQAARVNSQFLVLKTIGTSNLRQHGSGRRFCLFPCVIHASTF